MATTLELAFGFASCAALVALRARAALRRSSAPFDRETPQVRRCCRCGGEGHLGYECSNMSEDAYRAGAYTLGPGGERVPEPVEIDPNEKETDMDDERRRQALMKVPSLKGPSGSGPPPPPPPPPTRAAAGRGAGKKRLSVAETATRAAADEAKLAKRKQVANDNSDAAEEKLREKEAKLAAEGGGAGGAGGGGAAASKVQCPRCDALVLQWQWDSGDHMASHSSEITPYLYLGGERNAHNHKELCYRTGVGYVLNVTCETACFFKEEIEYLRLKVEDRPSFAAELDQCFDAATVRLRVGKHDRQWFPSKTHGGDLSLFDESPIESARERTRTHSTSPSTSLY